MAEANLRTIESLFTAGRMVHEPALHAPVEHFLSEIRRATGLSDEELGRMDLGGVERRMNLRFRVPNLLPGIHESASTLHSGLCRPYDSRRHRQAIGRLLERDRAAGARRNPVGTPPRV